MPIVVLVRYQSQPSKHERAIQEITTLVRTVTTEPGCLGIAILQRTDDDTAILLHERWTDQETYFGPHMQTPHINAFIEQAREFLAGPPDISVWHEV